MFSLGGDDDFIPSEEELRKLLREKIDFSLGVFRESRARLPLMPPIESPLWGIVLESVAKIVAEEIGAKLSKHAREHLAGLFAGIASRLRAIADAPKPISS